MVRLLLPLVCVFFQSLSAWSADKAPESDPSALKILDSALDAIQREHESLHGWQYQARLHSEQYDSGGKVIGSGDRTIRVRPGANPSEEIVSESSKGQLSFLKDDKPSSTPSPTPAKGADPDPKATPAKKVKTQPSDEPKSLDDAVRLYNLRERYLWTRLPYETTDNTSAYVLHFEPRPDFPAKTSAERFCGRIGGSVWISREDLSVLRVDAALLTPHPLLWIIATLQEMKFTYRLQEPNGEKFRPSLTKARIKVTLPFKTVRQLHTIEMDGYERISD